MKKITSTLLFLITLFLFAPISAKADGGMFYPHGYPVFETGQKAFIYTHDGIEDLVVQPSYRGSAKDFVWVVPTPSEPTVSKSSQSLFKALQKLTVPDEVPYQFSTMDISLSTKSTTEEVEIIDEKTIDSLNVVTLKASSETALSEWMKENQYSYPENKNYLLSDYINDGWYFVIAKVRPEALAEAEEDLNNGTVTPIRFTFKSEKPIYPMKLTRVAMEYAEAASQTNADDSIAFPKYNYYEKGTNITIYALTDRRVQNSQLNTIWANWINKKDIKKILAESTEQDWINSSQKLYLTKMNKYISTNSIKEDFVLADNQNNEVYPKPFYKENIYWKDLFATFGLTALGLLLSPLFLLFVIFSIKQKYEEKWFKKAKWFKAILILLSLAVGLYLFVAWTNTYAYTSFYKEGGPVGAILAFVILELILIVLTIRDFRIQKLLNQ